MGLAAITVNACGEAEPSPIEYAPANAEYVAMGSSMASGPGLGPPKPDTPPRCMRTAANYPTLLAEKLGVSFEDATCGGATTEHVLGPWNELPPQIDAVTPNAKIVTITIGGNDLNYVAALLAAGCVDGKMTLMGSSHPCPSNASPAEADYAKVEDNLRRIGAEVSKRAPEARLVFVEYVRLVPAQLCAATPISEKEAEKARAIADRLAAITANVAQETGALHVPVHALSADHTPCDPEPWAVGAPADYDGSDGAPWHPNFAGMRAVAERTFALLEK